MRAIEQFDLNLNRLQTVGQTVRQEGRARGVSIFYIDERDRTMIVEERPDGSTVRRPHDWKAHLDRAAE